MKQTLMAYSISLLSFSPMQSSALNSTELRAAMCPSAFPASISPSIAIRLTLDGFRPGGDKQEAWGGTVGSSSRGGRPGWHAPGACCPPPSCWNAASHLEVEQPSSPCPLSLEHQTKATHQAWLRERQKEPWSQRLPQQHPTSSGHTV